MEDLKTHLTKNCLRSSEPIVSPSRAEQFLQKEETPPPEQYSKEQAQRAIAFQAIANGRSREDAKDLSGLTMRQVIQVEADVLSKAQHGVLVASYLEQRKRLLPKVLECGLNLLANGLQYRMSQPEPLSLKEAEIVSRIISNVDHIARLDAGDPTQIVDVNRTVPATLQDLVKTLKKDPFIDTVQLIKEISDDRTGSTEDDGSGGEAEET